MEKRTHTDTSKLLVLIWHLVLISLIIWQTLFNWKHSSNFHWDCKMAGHSSVTETLGQEVVQMKVKEITLSAIAWEVGHSKSVISQILHVFNDTNQFKSPNTASCPSKTNAREDRIMQRLSILTLFSKHFDFILVTFRLYSRNISTLFS